MDYKNMRFDWARLYSANYTFAHAMNKDTY